MNIFSKSYHLILLTILCFILTPGCESNINNESTEPVTTDMHDDFSHNHKHSHGEGHDHGHDHADHHEGAHSHEHSHSHSHAEPLYGGKIHSIGHTHHKDGETHYHVEVLPVDNHQIVFHILSISKEDKATPYTIDSEAITGYINEEDGDSVLGKEVKFASKNKGRASSEFFAEIPESLYNSKKLMVLIPKISLGGEALSFSFKVKQNPSDDKKTDTKQTKKTDTNNKDKEK